MADIDGEILLLNPVFESVSGHTEDDLVEVHLRDIFLTMQDSPNPLSVETLTEIKHDFLLLLSSNSLKPVSLELQEIEGQKYLGVLKEIIETKITADIASPPREQKMPVESAVPAKTTKIIFADEDNNLQHEVRTMLNGILGYGSALKFEKAIEENSRYANYLDGILTNGQKLKALFDKSISPGSRSKRVTLSLLSPALLLKKIVVLLGSFAKEQNAAIHVAGDEDVLIISDETRLQNILHFFVHKAILFTRSGEVRININKDAASKKLLIDIDNIGMDIPNPIIQEINREKVLPEYNTDIQIFSNNPEISEILSDFNLIDAKLEINISQPSEQIASILLPLNSENTPAETLTAIESEIKLKNASILIVEDNKINARVLSLFLEKVAEVSIAYSGNEAINLIENTSSSGKVFSLIFMDIGLPEPWDGIMLKNEIEKRWPQYKMVPFVAQTAFAQDSWTERILQGDFRKCLIKPLDRIEVMQTVNKLI